jgi:hypothetical protein
MLSRCKVGDLGERRLGVPHALLKRALNFLLSLDSFFDPVKLRGQVVVFVQFFLGDMALLDLVVVRPRQVADVVEQEAQQPNGK